MGLAPWASQWSGASPTQPPPRLTSGDLLDGGDGGFRLHWDAIEGLPRPNELGDVGLRPFYAALAGTAQRGLEEAAMGFVAGLRERTGEENVCLCGGVALNSVLNGRVAREVSQACPGDGAVILADELGVLRAALGGSDTPPSSLEEHASA